MLLSYWVTLRWSQLPLLLLVSLFFTIHVSWISIVKFFTFWNLLSSSPITFPSPQIATSINVRVPFIIVIVIIIITIIIIIISVIVQWVSRPSTYTQNNQNLQKTHCFLLTNISLQSQCHCTAVNQHKSLSHYNIATVCLTATVLGDVRSSGILHSVWRWSLTDVSGQPTRPIFNGQWRWVRKVVSKCR